MRRLRARAAAALAGAALVMIAVASATPGRAGVRAAAAATTTAIPVDRQAYVTTSYTTDPRNGQEVDAYGEDPTSLHVAIHGGQEYARSFVHLALDYIPEGAQATDAVLTLHIPSQSDASNTGVYTTYNVNTSAAIVEACALVTPLPANFDRTHPPAFDCQHGSAVGKPDSTHDTWTFDLRDLVAYWNQHGNTGAALVPVGSGDASQTWDVAFYTSRSAAVVTYVPPPAVAGPPSSALAPGPAPAPVPASGTGVTPAPAGPRTAVTPGTPAPGAGTVAPATPPPSQSLGAPRSAPSAGITAPVTTRSHRRSLSWPWVLIAALLVAGVIVGFANRERLRPPDTSPRAYTLAAIAAVWGLVFAGYSIVEGVPSVTGALASSSTGNSTGATALPGESGATGTGAGDAGTSGTASEPGIATSPSGSAAGGSGPTGAQTQSAVGSNPAATEFTGPGTYQTINGVQVFFPAAGGPPVAQLFQGADDTIGITNNQIELCGHAALTYGSAFNINASDLNVFWTSLNAQGGIYGRSVHGDYQNDNYDPGTAVQAAQACKDLNTFLLLGGIGFDQIPAVRQWAEQNHELYLHHIATIENTAGLRYSFSSQPTVEQVGTWFGQLAVQQFTGKKIGILYRNSSNWSPGVTAFEQVVKAAGIKIVGAYPVTINQGNYTQELTQLEAAGAQVVWGWENALAEVEMIKQAESQNWYPAWMVFPFNLETNTLGAASAQQQLWGIATWDAYDPGYYGGGFSSYASDIHEFETEYKKYDPGANLSGDGGDLLFLNWEAQRQIADLLQVCGAQCTRNKIAGILLAGYHRPVSPACNVNFALTADHHHGGYLANVFEVQKDPTGRLNWTPTQRCVSTIGGSS